MKKLCTKNKGKVYPSPSSSSSSSSSSSQSLNPDSVLSVLNFLPATILTLAAILSGEDREVLAFLITRSLKTTDPSSLIEEKKKCKKPNTPNFECGCFECYTGYWFRWDSSPNRELIHQVIEAFEDHLTNGEKPKRGSCNKGRKREKVFDKTPTKKKEPEKQLVLVPDDEAEEEEVVVVADKFQGLEEVEVESVVEKVQVLAVSEQHKRVARKVLPDVMGLFNSRLWSFWNLAEKMFLHETRRWLELGEVEASQVDTLLVAVGRSNCVSCSVDLCTQLLCFCLHAYDGSANGLGGATGLDCLWEGAGVKIMEMDTGPLSLIIF